MLEREDVIIMPVPEAFREYGNVYNELLINVSIFFYKECYGYDPWFSKDAERDDRPTHLCSVIGTMQSSAYKKKVGTYYTSVSLDTSLFNDSLLFLDEITEKYDIGTDELLEQVRDLYLLVDDIEFIKEIRIFDEIWIIKF